MNFDFAEKINYELEKLNFENAITIAKKHLNEINQTSFHKILEHSFTNNVEDCIKWIDSFYKKISKHSEIKAFYFELNEFDINTEKWYIQCFAFEFDGGYNPEDMEWLSDCNPEIMTKEEFVLTGLEDFQNLFENFENLIENDDVCQELQDARDWTEQIIISKFMQFIHKVHLTAKNKNLEWANIPFYFTEHEYDFIVQSK